VNIDMLNGFEDGTEVDLNLVLSNHLAKSGGKMLKVLGCGELTTKLTVRAAKFSASAKEKIEAAGGTAEVIA